MDDWSGCTSSRDPQTKRKAWRKSCNWRRQVKSNWNSFLISQLVIWIEGLNYDSLLGLFKSMSLSGSLKNKGKYFYWKLLITWSGKVLRYGSMKNVLEPYFYSPETVQRDCWSRKSHTLYTVAKNVTIRHNGKHLVRRFKLKLHILEGLLG